MPDFIAQPGLYFVAATLLPLASFVLILLASAGWALCRTYRETHLGEQLYNLFGGDKGGRGAAYVAIAAIGGAFVLSLTGFILFTIDQGAAHRAFEEVEQEIASLEKEAKSAEGAEQKALKAKAHEKESLLETRKNAWEARRSSSAWRSSFEWLRINPPDMPNEHRATGLRLGFAIDSLSALMFVMVTFIATLIHLFSIGYMSDELAETVEDHQVDAGHWDHIGHTAHPAHADHAEADAASHGHHGRHLERRGRFGRFFLYLSLFCFSMLNLVLADNLFQVFLSWELVGICSFLLIGFYFERKSASNAANKAFITNRVGDAGFIIGLLILWTYVGTFNFEDIFKQLRHPLSDAHGHAGKLAGQIVRGDFQSDEHASIVVAQPGAGGSQVILFPVRPILTTADPAREKQVKQWQEELETTTNPRKRQLLERKIEAADGHFDNARPGRPVPVSSDPLPEEPSSMPYWLLVTAGLGIFLGCVGKSAQFPLSVWLPDAMEGPTPVSALIHAATMVAAGVYLVGRCYPLFTPEALLVIAYTGGITLFVAATIAVVMTDIKKVLAYSTVSQLGYMMLALGIGGWVAGLFHLFTHAFFKALLFLCSGSVIYGCHHEQEMTKMGGLFPKMKITAWTMLAGVLAIAGIPLFSGWYSKDSIMAQALGYVSVHPEHLLLLLLPLATAGLTTFYMFRMWFMTFTGAPRDQHVHEHAHESPWPMTVPLIVLAVCSIAVAWGWPLWDAEASHLEHNIHHAQPSAVMADFGHIIDPDSPKHNESWPEVAAKVQDVSERHHAHKYHHLAGYLAMGVVALGIVFSSLIYYNNVLDPAEAKEQFPKLHSFLMHKWHFDELYSAMLVRPVLVVGRWCRAFDLGAIDGVLHAIARTTIRVARWEGRFDSGFIDYLVNLVGSVTYTVGSRLRKVQTGSLRSYVLFLVLCAVGIFVALSYFVALASAG